MLNDSPQRRVSISPGQFRLPRPRQSVSGGGGVTGNRYDVIDDAISSTTSESDKEPQTNADGIVLSDAESIDETHTRANVQASRQIPSDELVGDAIEEYGDKNTPTDPALLVRQKVLESRRTSNGAGSGTGTGPSSADMHRFVR